jgi:phospholipase/carboxylesterase
MLHGFGADNQDLASLSTVIADDRDITWIFPNAPLEVPIGPHMMGRAWFPIDMQAIEKAMQEGTHRDLTQQHSEEFFQAAMMVANLIEEIDHQPSQVILGGFSQGAMISCEVALKMESQLDALVILSGNPIALDGWTQQMPSKKGLKVFQSHGMQDQVLSFEKAKMLHDLLESHELDTCFVPFNGGHEIPMPVISELNKHVFS